MLNPVYRIHFILRNVSIPYVVYAYQIPAVGDEIRLDTHYYKVTQRVWCYDEPECPYSRVNIELEACT